MPLKQASLSKAYSGLQCCICTYSTSTSPSVLPIPRARPDKRRRVSSRSYATANKFEFRDNLNWPSQKKQGGPSPYEIFEIEKGGVYTKHKFYELVKMYHPDRHSHHNSDHPVASLSRVECLERYRLVVRAHEILSDPAKRKAFDMSGAGWGEKTTQSNTPQYTQDSQDSPFNNATWEDWERWYARNSGGHGPQTYEGTYINPNMFASLVVFVAIIAGVLQATHAGQFTGSIEERAKAFTAQTHQFISERKQDNTKYRASGYSGHGLEEDNRPHQVAVRHFLERRDPTRFGLNDEEEETYRNYFAGKSVSGTSKASGE
jgi:hypothetical protein